MSQTPNTAIAVIGIDIGKNSFHVVGHDARGAIVLRQKWSRGQVEARLANIPPCLIGMEACERPLGIHPRCTTSSTERPDVHIVIKPDKNCVVNSGLGSIRGARMAEMSYRGTQHAATAAHRSNGMALRADAADKLGRCARSGRTRYVAVINDMGEDGLFVSAFDHGGAGGGYENTWGTGKLYFGAMKVKNIRIHNRPAYNSEVHATRDMGVGELNNCYEDAELADTIVAVGTNALETQTNYFLNHWVPNLRGTSMDKKRAEFGSEAVERG